MYVPWNPLEVMCISVLWIFWKWKNQTYIDQAGCNIFKVGSIFRGGYPN